MRKCMSPEEVAQMYSVHKQTVWRWIREGRLSAVRIGRNYYVRPRDLDEMESKFCTAQTEADNA